MMQYRCGNCAMGSCTFVRGCYGWCMSSAAPKPTVICILDGWGDAPPSPYNAIYHANTPTFDYVRATYPHGLINASEKHVGLPCDQMGNSEVGHMNLGAGRVVMQDLPRIDHAIATGALANDNKLQAFIAALKISGGTCHLMGLASDGGVHAHIDHMLALARIVADAGVSVAIHAFLDGRDCPPQSAQGFLQKLLQQSAQHERINLVTMVGRYYAMDRDKRWERVALAYSAVMDGVGEHASDPLTALKTSYARGENDEFVKPFVFAGYSGMKDGDGMMMANFRADRARQWLHALTDHAFDGFTRARTVECAATLGMVRYSDALAVRIPALFEPEALHETFGEVLAKNGLQQLRIAETEKYAHVTFFFNGGREEVFDGEERILVPSPKVATYDLKPEMAAPEVAAHVVHAIRAGDHHAIIVNFANTDMVGHSGDMHAAIKAVEAVDIALSGIVAALEDVGGAMLLTADHGNAEAMHDDASGQAHTQHTLNLVPLVALHPKLKHNHTTLPTGALADIAPTALAMMGIAQPAVMDGKNLLKGIL